MGLVTRLAGSLNFDVAAACGIVLLFRYFMRPVDSSDGHGLLVGGLEHFSFFHILEIIIPTDN